MGVLRADGLADVGAELVARHEGVDDGEGGGAVLGRERVDEAGALEGVGRGDVVLGGGRGRGRAGAGEQVVDGDPEELRARSRRIRRFRTSNRRATTTAARRASRRSTGRLGATSRSRSRGGGSGQIRILKGLATLICGIRTHGSQDTATGRYRV